MNNLIIPSLLFEASEHGIKFIRTLPIQLQSFDKIRVIDIVKYDLPNGGTIISLLDGETAIDFVLELCKRNMTSPKYTVLSLYLNEKDVNNNIECMNGHYYYLYYHNISHYYTSNISKANQVFHSKYNRYENQYDLHAGTILGLLLLHYTIQNISDYTIDNTTFREILKSAHSIQIPEFPQISSSSSNHLSYTYGLYKVEKQNISLVYNYSKSISANPWLGYNNETVYYYCDWNVDENNEEKRSDKTPKKTILVGIILSTTGEYNEIEIAGIDPIMTEIFIINKKGGLFGEYMLVGKVYDGKSTEEGGLEAAKLAVSDKADVLIGCYLNTCRKLVSAYLLPLKKVLWYPSIFEGQECLENVIYTGMITNQYIDIVIEFLTQISTNKKNLLLVGEESPYNNLIFGVIKKRLADTSFNITDKRTISMMDMDLIVKDWVANNKEGGSIYTTFDANEWISLVNSLTKYIYTRKIYQIVCNNIDKEMIRSFSITDFLDFYIAASHFDETDGKESILYKHTFGETGKGWNTAFGESSSIAIRFWIAGNENAGELKLDYDLFDYLYNISIDISSGEIQIAKNHYTSLTVSIAQWIPFTHSVKVISTRKKPKVPMAYNWDIDGFDQLVCDWTNKDILSKGFVDSLNVLLAYSQTGYNKERENGLSIVIDLCVSEINNKNGILKKEVFLTSIDITSDDTSCSNIFNLTLTTKRYDVIFTTASSTCLKLVKSIYMNYDIPIFQIGYTEGESCEENIYYISREPSIMNRVIDAYSDVRNIVKMRFVLIGNTDSFSQKTIEYTINYLDYKHLTVGINNIVDPTETDFTSIVSSILSSQPDGCTILFFGSITNHKGLDSALRKENVDINKYPLDRKSVV